jgi:hypothetical protein
MSSSLPAIFTSVATAAHVYGLQQSPTGIEQQSMSIQLHCLCLQLYPTLPTPQPLSFDFQNLPAHDDI